MQASRGVLLVALALLAIAALRDLGRLGEAAPWRQLYDFADFYCAGAALDAGADPYRYEPLHDCEHVVNRSAVFRADPHRVIPAPLPPYDFPPFMLLARSSFAFARTIDALAIVAAIAAAICGFWFLGVPLELAASALVLSAGYVLLNAGQVVPFALVALVACGVALARRREGIAGVLAALTAIEPHLGLPVCVALVAWVPRSRVPIAGMVLLLAVVSLVTTGGAEIVEYLTRVLPAQAAAETGYVYQYSLTYLMHGFGASASAALVAGEFSYIAMLVLGVWLGRRLAEKLGRPELLAYLPAACSIVAGPYVHMVDLGFAIPAALVLSTNLHGRSKDVAAFAVCLLAVPWIPVWIAKKLFLAALFVVAAILLRLRIAATASVAIFASIAAIIYVFELFPPAPFAGTTAAFSPSALAQQAWSQSVAQLANPSALWLAIKLPTWIALLSIIALSFYALRDPRIVERSSP
ncbi:MAG: hypothetical protein JO104_09655 [Candidatus Eremiobacteraeota bacterium]|nr:hypothetical protein [Candidatus Eremiobacteraeota bacterium]